MKVASENIASIPLVALPPAPPVIIPYEHRLAGSIAYVLDEGGKLFMGESEVNKTLQRITRQLNELQIPYAVAGGMALIAHGFRRFTEDIDILVTQAGLDQIHEHLDGRGWVRPFSASKNLRDADNGVRVEFLISGGFPGDGLPKPVSFPEPQDVAEDHEGIQYLNLPTFVTLKLASGMTNHQRGKDLADVEELIRTLKLTKSFSIALQPFVRDKFLDLWQRQQTSANRFYAAWNCPGLPSPPQKIADILVVDQSPGLRQMEADGVQLAPELSSSDQAVLFTYDTAVAAKYGMLNELEVDLKRLRQHPANG